ncbi:helix-turn-helix transcriptional regulator [Pseudomonas sp.]|uniref:helix-turn-helix transcriptional regulator n=1 Tax=Pseudomonas sp. TaxID=306 RepID=UPI002735B3BB|nr:PAS domain-containing protein [Pseudomonas sp.]MDP3816250.1 helix-turn-helix transcriptional regulator [Pseudomonas sp.]
MPRVDEQKRYDDLVGLCYECVLDESKWPDLLERLMHASGRQQGGLLSQLKHANFVQISEVNFFDSAALAPYSQHYCHMDPGHLFMPQRAVGHWYHDVMDYGVAAIQRSPYYQEFHRPYGLGNLSSIKLYETATSSAYLSLLTNLDANSPNQQQQSLLKRIAAHLTTAGRLSERIHHLELGLAKRDLLLDNHPAPLWLLDADGRVLYCNHVAARRLSQSGFPLHERLAHLHSKHQDTSLQALIRRAAGKGGQRRAGWLRLNATQQQELLVTPVPAHASFNQHFQKPLVLLALLEKQPKMGLLAELFQLTPAEQRLADLLAQSLTPESCAERLSVSINTVRSQLRALFRKTDTERQAELVQLFARVQQR